MPVQECTLGGKPGFKYGQSGTCYTHDGSAAGIAAAKQKAVKQAIAIGGGKAPRDLEQAEPELVADAVREYAELETVDLAGVEIMASGGPFKGVGSPPEGDNYTTDDLKRFVDAATDLADAGLKPPAKIGHEATAPRVGWLDRIRLNEKGDAILADVRDVPKKFAALIKAGAYRARSPELYRITSQKTGKAYDAIGALAWLGGRRPAIQRLSDFDVDQVFGLYEELAAEFMAAYEFENPDPPAAERLLEAALDLATTNAELAAKLSASRADTRATVPETKFTEEQRRKFAEATGLETDKVTDAMLASAGIPETDPTPPPPDPTPPKPEGDEPTRALEAKVETLEKTVQAAEKRAFEAERDALIVSALKDGRFEPGERDSWEKAYELNPEGTRAAIERLPKSDDLAREYGTSDDGTLTTEEQRKLEDDAYRADASVRLGVPKEQLL